MPRRTQWELFLDRHRPRPNHLDSNAAENGFLFETFGPEWEFVRDQDCHHVFTLVEGDTGRNFYACPGFHIVNRMGYFVIEVPWTVETEAKVYKT